MNSDVFFPKYFLIICELIPTYFRISSKSFPMFPNDVRSMSEWFPMCFFSYELFPNCLRISFHLLLNYFRNIHDVFFGINAELFANYSRIFLKYFHVIICDFILNYFRCFLSALFPNYLRIISELRSHYFLVISPVFPNYFHIIRCPHLNTLR